MPDSKVTKKMLVIALGSNLGNRYAYLVQAKRLLGKRFGRSYKYSQVYETPPWGNTDQGAFFNAVACFSTDLPPEECLEVCNQVEQELGRTRHEKWGERTIDIDILFYGGEQFTSDLLVIPHPELEDRAFVLRPLMDVIPTFVHPVSGLSVDQLYRQLQGEKEFEVYSTCF